MLPGSLGGWLLWRSDVRRARVMLAGWIARHAVSASLTLFDSYHCSRYNTNTGRLTRAMFRAVFRDVAAYLGRPAPTA